MKMNIRARLKNIAFEALNCASGAALITVAVYLFAAIFGLDLDMGIAVVFFSNALAWSVLSLLMRIGSGVKVVDDEEMSEQLFDELHLMLRGASAVIIVGVICMVAYFFVLLSETLLGRAIAFAYAKIIGAA
jgi:hypothetical protein